MTRNITVKNLIKGDVIIRNYIILIVLVKYEKGEHVIVKCLTPLGKIVEQTYWKNIDVVDILDQDLFQTTSVATPVWLC